VSGSDIKGSKGLKGSVKSNGSHSSGGKAGHGVPVRQARSNNTSARSRVNQHRWDWSDGNNGDSMTYQYQEYPKHVYPHADKPKHYVVVNSAEEESQILGGEEIINDEHERVRLLTVAKVKNVPVDKRWGPAKLTKAIEDAGFDPTLNPFK
jgi:hypothetical protein